MSEEATNTAVTEAEAEERLEQAVEHHASPHEIDVLGEQLDEANHPNDRSYVGIAVFLGVMTLIEVSTYWPFGDFFGQHHTLLIIVLSVLMIIKFATVAGYFMHLKFDSKAYRGLFTFGIVLALAVFFAVMFSMNLFS